MSNDKFDKIVKETMKTHNKTFIRLRIAELEEQIARQVYGSSGYFSHPHWEKEKAELEKELKKWKKILNANDSGNK